MAADQKYFEVEISHPAFSGPSNIILTMDQAGGAALGGRKDDTRK